MKNANPVLRRAAGWRRAISRWSAIGAASALSVLPPAVLTGCDKGAPPAAVRADAAAPKTVADFFPIAVGGTTVRMQLAVREAEMQRGLMGRRDLGRADGMIFVYEKPQRMSFWMRNTPTPLDIGFFGPDGVLAEVYPLHPFDETAVGSRGERLQFALEMNQGWFQANGVKPGARIDLKALAAALEARGFAPGKFGLRGE